MEFVCQRCCLAYLATKYLREPPSKSYALIFFAKICFSSEKFVRVPALGEKVDHFSWHMGLSHRSSVIVISKSGHTGAGTWRQLFWPCVENMSVCCSFVCVVLMEKLENQEIRLCWELCLVIELLAEGTDRWKVSPTDRMLLGFAGSKPLSLYDLITPLRSLPWKKNLSLRMFRWNISPLKRLKMNVYYHSMGCTILN